MKVLTGIVVSTKMEKTAVVEVTRRTPHPLYKKLLKRSKKYKVDIAGFTPTVGQQVRIVKIAPISKDKHFKIAEIVQVGKGGKK